LRRNPREKLDLSGDGFPLLVPHTPWSGLGFFISKKQALLNHTAVTTTSLYHHAPLGLYISGHFGIVREFDEDFFSLGKMGKLFKTPVSTICAR
jgi:hypothetical protein